MVSYNPVFPGIISFRWKVFHHVAQGRRYIEIIRMLYNRPGHIILPESKMNAKAKYQQKGKDFFHKRKNVRGWTNKNEAAMLSVNVDLIL